VTVVWNRLSRWAAHKVARWERAARLLPPGSRVLDLGCAFGYGTAIVARAHEVYGVDASTPFIQRACSRYPHIPFTCAPAEAIPFEDSFFDAVLLLDVLEHVRRESVVLAEVSRVLRPGGTLVVSAPHKGIFHWLDSLNVWDFLAGGGSHPPDEVIAGGYRYHRHYREVALRRLLQPWFVVNDVELTGLGLVELLNLTMLALGKGLLRSQAIYDRLAYLYYGAYIAEDRLHCGSASYHIMARATRI
jgi:2-polyprenyl-3-methyl-5-hydroxy-6-metoxy-1,4-benzoquinol methylase